MSTFTIPEEFAGTRLYSGGREYEFDGTELECTDEADAKRVRVFAVEHPEYGIAEDGETVPYIEAPEADPEPEATEPEAEPEGDAEDEDEGDGDAATEDNEPADDEAEEDAAAEASAAETAPEADVTEAPADPEPTPRRRKARPE